MADSPSEPRAKRQRVDKAGRFAALERLRNLKGSKHKYEVKEEVDDVYEVVDEREYAKRAREKYGNDWIEDDGTGYAEDGRDFFEDEDEYSEEEIDDKKDKNKKNSKKRPREGDKPVKGKSSIRNLFSNAVPKKTKVTSLAEDNILADILGEMHGNPKSSTSNGIKNASETEVKSTGVIAPARIVSKSTRKSDAALAKEYMNSFINNIKMSEPVKKPEEASDDELLDRILKPKQTVANKKSVEKPKVKDEKAEAANQSEVQVASKKSVGKPRFTDEKTTATEQSEKPVAFKKASVVVTAEKPVEHKKLEKIVEKTAPLKETKTPEADFPDDDMDFSCLQSEENRFDKVESVSKKNAVKKLTLAPAKDADDLQNLLSNWEQICQMDNFEAESAKSESNASMGTSAPDTLKFWYWEAWEDPNKCPGEVFLFGRTAENKSICVRVEKIDRILYLLPRKYLLDPITKEQTGKLVQLSDLYKEFDDDISVELKLDGFRSRKVTKNFGNHSIGIDVPQVCDYMEIHYDGKKPPPNLKKKYNSIAHIFGANTTAMERFLLDRKIKGPCWLTLNQFRANPAPISWCNTDVSVSEPKGVTLSEDPKPQPPPPLTLLTLNVRTALNPKTLKNEICMISMLVHNRFHIDRPAPQPAFNRSMCGFTRPVMAAWPYDLKAKLAQFKAINVAKHDNERALLMWFLAMYQQIDADLIVTFDAIDCQLDVITDRIATLKVGQWSRLGRVRLSAYTSGRKWLEHFAGRMVCDVKRTASEEKIKARSYDLQTLCQAVLEIKENERMDVNDEDLLQMFETGDGVLKLVTLTMQDAAYVLRMMYKLDLLPLALQITNICGNTMTRTLQHGRSERIEFLLLHAFTDKNYIVPDKKKREWSDNNNTIIDGEVNDTTAAAASSGRKKAAYAGGMVLDPIAGLYDKYILLMDFNSLYPSIIQEYNICFTTVQQPYNAEDLPQLPDPSIELGILPQQLRRLVQSRREVKKLMAKPDVPPEQLKQYDIRQWALKITANAMYGCLGAGHSRFAAQHLAALVTHKGREILLNTKSLVQKMNYEVVYGDTDSIMVNTNILDYDQVFTIGSSIKQSVNKMYKQVELGIDGVFSCLLLLKKKKYAAVKVDKNPKTGALVKVQEQKGLDIVRRDWSQLAIMVGRIVLDEILSEKQLDEKLDAVHSHLEKIRGQVESGAVPLPMYTITKQLSKAPTEFNNAISQPHVQVALRMNSTRNRRYKKGDMVDYVICLDGTNNPATQRGYHLDEVKSSETLKLDTQYYLAHQIHPVVTRMVDVLEGTDASRVAESLGLDPSKFRAAAQRSHQERTEDTTGESLVKTTLQKYRECDKFKFVCIACKAENIVATAFRPNASNSYDAVLQKCANSDCSTAPYQYIVAIRNRLLLSIRSYIKRFYQNWLVCDDPSCNQNTRFYTHVTTGNRPICPFCKTGSLVRQYSERNLYQQLSYFQYMFDLSKYQHKHVPLTPETEAAYQTLVDTVNQQLEKSAFCTISLGKLFSSFKPLEQSDEISHKKIEFSQMEMQVATSLDDN
ncbi:PREDICTED: DNA polymerase alpha catalytic subunit [Rhagoletis zephyria]|uniref:DNA polymerase alpha catalytic subunit n=1 Tax=Rhagoletis zephyria TaxID=28612 RepID=UPI0008116114|nr:PREDICTED: DNA polymerase alpha catalytic subunit [Rhagoletis zephyria]